MKYIILLMMTMLATHILAQEKTLSKPRKEVAAFDDKLWFNVGEELVYKIYWGYIPVGKSYISTKWIENNGKKQIAIRFRTRSNDFLSKIYPVDDFLESIVDPETFLPIQFTKKLKEGKYRCHEVTTFDFEQKKAVWKSIKNETEKTFEIDDDTRDIICFMYYMRKRKLEPGREEAFRVMADEKMYDLQIKIRQIEKVSIEHYGEIESLKLEPEAAFDGLTVRKGKSWLWISQDQRRLCTKLAVEVPIAKVFLYLDRVKGPGEDFWVAKN